MQRLMRCCWNFNPLTFFTALQELHKLLDFIASRNSLESLERGIYNAISQAAED